eukprot:659-Pelagococcus_subviridis.AAC.3
MPRASPRDRAARDRRDRRRDARRTRDRVGSSDRDRIARRRTVVRGHGTVEVARGLGAREPVAHDADAVAVDDRERAHGALLRHLRRDGADGVNAEGGTEHGGHCCRLLYA